jgi:hypothetical protein
MRHFRYHGTQVLARINNSLANYGMLPLQPNLFRN